MKLNKLALTVLLMLFSAVTLYAQENNDVASSEGANNLSTDEIIAFNPSGVNFKIADDKLLVYFKNRMSNLRCEIINKKGDLLLVTKAKSTQYSTLDISGLKKGTYFLRVRFYDGTLKEFLKFSKD